eukprot:Phypoly_transcript_05893.p1 GENE.Phypoly_transcript_05893~~Phypoly_transcript_05893.p1  ORF type:complete len:624 (+),score=89.29 Phypoly_transcript_05893:72-1874(+)
MSQGLPIPKVNVLAEGSLVSSSPDWRSAAPGSMHRDDVKGSWQGQMNLRGAHNSLHQRVDSLDSEDYSNRFFQPLLVSDPSDRRIAMANIEELLLQPENEKLLRAHIRSIVRMSTESPFDDIMDGCRNILLRVSREFDHVRIPKPSPGPSRFIPAAIIPPIDTDDPTISRIFQDLFLQVGRVTHTIRILAVHPAHLKRYHMTFSKIMREPGPLPPPWRNYIAILAASRYNCTYLAALQESEFRANSGDPAWLQGVEHAPKKIQNLLTLTALMTHQPWHLTKDHIEPLVKGHDAWSISELVHAMLLISTYVSLAGFLFGCSVTPEIDLEICEDGDSEADVGSPEIGLADDLGDRDGDSEDGMGCTNSDNRERKGSANADTVKLMELLKKGIAEEEGGDNKDKVNDFANAGTDWTTDTSRRNSTSLPGPKNDLSRYTGSVEMRHTDFDVKSKNYNIFLVQEYGWKEHGYELLRRFYPDIADLLDEEFTQTYSMTYNTFSTSTHIDTLPFRRAIWYYVQRVKGMCHDDYNYQEVNLLLNRDVKFFVKKIACMPDSITQHDFDDLGLELRPEEKCHIALLAMESHKQACLLYGLHAVMQYMNRY